MYYYDSLLKNLKEKSTNTQLSDSEVLDILQTPRDIPQEMNQPQTSQVGELFKKADHLEIDHYKVLDVINKMVDSVYERDENQIQYVKNMAEVRGLDPENLIKNHCFFSPDVGYMERTFADLELYKRDYHVSTSQNTLWKGRFIIPLRDFHGKVYGFVGYDKFSEAKYVEWSAPTYKQMAIKALGLDNIEFILKKRYCILTEGNFDYFRGRQHELPIIANLGVSFNHLLKPLLDKLDMVFTIYDNDKAGQSNVETIKRIKKMTYNVVFLGPEKTPGDKGKSPIKIDLDDYLRNEDNLPKLQHEINIRLKFPKAKLKDIKL